MRVLELFDLVFLFLPLCLGVGGMCIGDSCCQVAALEQGVAKERRRRNGEEGRREEVPDELEAKMA